MAKEAPHLLTELALEEISAVNAGANKGAKIILRKSESDIMETKERYALIKTLAKYFNVGKQEGDTLVIKTGDEPVSEDLEKLQKTVSSQTIVILKLVAQNAFATLLSVVKDAIAKAANATGIDTLLAKAKTDLIALIKDSEITDQAELIKQFEAALDGDLMERAKARKAELEKSTSKADMAKFRDRLPPDVQKTFDALDDDKRTAFMNKFSKFDDTDPVAKALENVTNENASLKKRLDNLESESEVAKAEQEFEGLSKHVALAEFIPNIIKLRKVDSDAAEVLITQIKAMAAQANAANIFSIFGKNGQGEGDADSALDKAVQKYRVENPDCASDEIAMTKVLEDPANASLYTDVINEQEEAD